MGTLVANVDFAAGVELNTFDTARMIATFTENVISNNRLGGSTIDGIRAVTAGQSEMALQVFSNDIRNNKTNGVFLRVEDDSLMVALLRLNSITGNGSPTATPAVLATIPVTSTRWRRLCLELSSNAASNNYVLNNLQPLAAFGYTDDLQNTGIIVPNADVTLEAPGTCAAAIVPLLVFP